MGAPPWPGRLSGLPGMAEAFGTLPGAAAVVLRVAECSVGTCPSRERLPWRRELEEARPPGLLGPHQSTKTLPAAHPNSACSTLVLLGALWLRGSRPVAVSPGLCVWTSGVHGPLPRCRWSGLHAASVHPGKRCASPSEAPPEEGLGSVKSHLASCRLHLSTWVVDGHLKLDMATQSPSPHRGPSSHLLHTAPDGSWSWKLPASSSRPATSGFS